MLNITKTQTVQFDALAAEIRAANIAGVTGASYNATDSIITLHLVDGQPKDTYATHDDPALVGNAAVQAARAIVDAHDPVFIAIDKPTIAANGTDTATITVTCTHPTPAAVTLIVGGVEAAITLTNGVGTLGVTSLDPATITVTVKNGQYRNPASYSIEVD